MMLASGAGIQVSDAAGLLAAVGTLAASDVTRLEMGRCGTALLQQCSGATERHLEIAAALLFEKNDGRGTSAGAASSPQGTR